LLRPLYRSLRAAASTLEINADSEVNILLTDDNRLRALNLEFRGIDRPTDVLSFAQEEPELLGDIAISLETADRQAAAAGWPESSEIALLGTHGLLHLVGYEDEELVDAQEMEAMTRRILTSAGVALPNNHHPFFTSFQSDE
jgi:probable rRNA maturation factor